MPMWYVWLALAIILSLLEILTPGFFLLCSGIACLAGMLASMAGLSLTVQILVFSTALILVIAFLRPVLGKFTKKSRTNAERMLGRRAELTEASSPNEKGKLRMDGVDWPVTSDKELPRGTMVEITGLEGITLHVKEVL